MECMTVCKKRFDILCTWNSTPTYEKMLDLTFLHELFYDFVHVSINKYVHIIIIAYDYCLHKE